MMFALTKLSHWPEPEEEKEKHNAAVTAKTDFLRFTAVNVEFASAYEVEKTASKSFITSN